MKKQLFSLTIVLTFLFVPFLLKGQGNYEDVVYLKNGSIIHGMIIEQVFEQSVKIKTRDNNIFVFQWNEIEKITKATVSKPRLFHNPGQTDNVYFGFFAGSTFAKLRPDAQKVCDDLAYSMNQEAGFSEFSFSPESRVGFAAGYYVYRRITGSLFFQTELLFSMKGVTFKGNGLYYNSSSSGYNVSVEETFILNYLDIPLYAKYYVFDKSITSKKRDRFNAYVLAGPAVGITLSKKMKTVVAVNGKSNEDKQNYDGFQGIDFSLDFGAGIELFRVLDIDFRYNLGLKNVLKDSVANSETLKNSVFMIGLGITFPI